MGAKRLISGRDDAHIGNHRRRVRIGQEGLNSISAASSKAVSRSPRRQIVPATAFASTGEPRNPAEQFRPANLLDHLQRASSFASGARRNAASFRASARPAQPEHDDRAELRIADPPDDQLQSQVRHLLDESAP